MEIADMKTEKDATQPKKIEATIEQLQLTQKQLGKIMLTHGIQEILQHKPDSKQYLEDCLRLHANGNWGTAGEIKATSVTEMELEKGMFATDKTAKLNLISIIKGEGPVISYFKEGSPLIPQLNIRTELNEYTVLMLPDED